MRRGARFNRSPPFATPPFPIPYFLFAALASLLFMRAAVFGWIRRLRPERSRSFTAWARSAAFPVPLTFLSAERSSLRWARFRAVWLLVCRICFLADLVLGTAVPWAKERVMRQAARACQRRPKYSPGNILPQVSELTFGPR